MPLENNRYQQASIHRYMTGSQQANTRPPSQATARSYTSDDEANPKRETVDDNDDTQLGNSPPVDI